MCSFGWLKGLDTISVPGPKRDWQALERKISSGKTVEKAASEAGIPLEEVFAYINNRLDKVDTINFQLRLISQKALKKSLDALEEIVDEGGRHYGVGGGDATDLKAAQTLAKIALDSLKISQKGEAPRKPEDKPPSDIFDLRPNPWVLNEIE